VGTIYNEDTKVKKKKKKKKFLERKIRRSC